MPFPPGNDGPGAADNKWTYTEGYLGPDGSTYKQWSKAAKSHANQVKISDNGMEVEMRHGGKWVTPHVTEVAVNGIAGHTTYRLSLSAKDHDVWNVYTVFGEKAHPLSIPPSWQEKSAFGVDIRGVDKAIFAVAASAKFDSWLTVGDNAGQELSTVGIDFASWSDLSALEVDNGAIFWSNPSHAPVMAASDQGWDGSVVVAQLTVRSGSTVRAMMNAQGRTSSENWVQSAIEFKMPAASTAR